MHVAGTLSDFNRKMRIAVAQINTTNGDIEGNVSKIIGAIRKAQQQAADLVVFPEIATHGYTSQDWFQDRDVISGAEALLERIIPETKGIAAAIGTIRPTGSPDGKPLYNTAAVISDGQLLGFADKVLMPEYDVFDDPRYFEPSKVRRTFEIRGRQIGVVVCEDFWNDETFWPRKFYDVDPTKEVISAGADLILALHASPFNKDKATIREQIVSHRAKLNGCDVVFVNLVGGNDGILFDGGSMVADKSGKIVCRAPYFEEALTVVDLSKDNEAVSAVKIPELEAIRQALVMGIRDYAQKNGFCKATLGLSGGIDSALVATLVAEAIGPKNLLCVMMPSQYSSPGSIEDSQQLIKNLGCESRLEKISDTFEQLSGQLGLKQPEKGGDSVAAENLQSRIRGMILMVISNVENRLLVSTGNKSELAVGYCTLYGDTNGGLAVLGDVLKTEVWALARHINESSGRELIPESIINKPPSAELAPGQRDDDTLPSYHEMDPILRLYFEHKMTADEIVGKGHDRNLVDALLKRVEEPSNEFKRRQLPPALIISRHAIGLGRRRPITQHYTKIR
mgnify:CR=1 FL=1